MRMKRLPLILLLAVSIMACNSKPDEVLNEKKLEDLLVDVYKCEAIVDNNRTTYKSDSMKAVVKQSVFLKHGVTQQQYDSSLVWYGHNVKKYIKIYENVIERLEDEEYELKNAGQAAGKRVAKRMTKRYLSSGDSADIWDKEQVFIFVPQYETNVLRFEFNTKSDDRNGDRYSFIFRARNCHGTVKAFLGLDYPDGSTSFVYRSTLSEGENVMAVQGDSTKRIRRVYGYVSAAPSVREAMFIDSIMLLRTRLDSAHYVTFAKQRLTSTKRLRTDTIGHDDEGSADVDSDAPDETGSKKSKRYTPKPGVNKSSHKAAGASDD